MNLSGILVVADTDHIEVVLPLSGASYNCISCHAPQAGVKPLVDNVSR